MNDFYCEENIKWCLERQYEILMSFQNDITNSNFETILVQLCSINVDQSN